MVSLMAFVNLIEPSWFLMGDLYRPTNTWPGLEIGSEHYTDDVFLRYRWHRIVHEVQIFGYGSSSEAVVSFSRNRRFSADSRDDSFGNERSYLSIRK
jgi:hypothetical protein